MTNSAKLLSGDTVGVIGLSAPCEPDLFRRSVSALERFGYRVKVALDPAKAYGSNEFLFSSDRPEARARALEDLFADPQVAAIMTARGAYGSVELLPLLDFEKIAKNPKPIIGFSDTTAILNALHEKAQIPALHGPSITSAFGKLEGQDVAAAQTSAQALLDYLSGANRQPYKDIKLTLLCGSGTFSAPIVGGNLTLLSALVGTDWEPNYQGKVLFIEETNERPYRIHRMLQQLKLARRLVGLKGVLLGSFINCAHPKNLGPDLLAVVRDIFGAAKIPVYGYIPAGHGDINLPVPLGVQVTVEGERARLIF